MGEKAAGENQCALCRVTNYSESIYRGWDSGRNCPIRALPGETITVSKVCAAYLVETFEGVWECAECEPAAAVENEPEPPNILDATPHTRRRRNASAKSR